RPVFPGKAHLRQAVRAAARSQSPGDRLGRAHHHTERRLEESRNGPHTGFAAALRERRRPSRQPPVSASPRTGRPGAGGGERRGEGGVGRLGSIASPKYLKVLLQIFGDRLRFPIDFVGRGDMSRGGLLLRKAAEGVELEYVNVAGAILHGPRPPKLEPLKRI